MNDVQLIVTIAVTAVLMTVIISFAAVVSRRESRSEILLKRLADLERINSLLTGPVPRMNAAIQAMFVQQLTHYHTPKIDRLLAKLSPYTLSSEEKFELINAMKARETDPEIGVDERLCARALQTIIELVAGEAAKPIDLFELKLVLVPKAAELGHVERNC